MNRLVNELLKELCTDVIEGHVAKVDELGVEYIEPLTTVGAGLTDIGWRRLKLDVTYQTRRDR